MGHLRSCGSFTTFSYTGLYIHIHNNARFRQGDIYVIYVYSIWICIFLISNAHVWIQTRNFNSFFINVHTYIKYAYLFHIYIYILYTRIISCWRMYVCIPQTYVQDITLSLLGNTYTVYVLYIPVIHTHINIYLLCYLLYIHTQ